MHQFVATVCDDPNIFRSTKSGIFWWNGNSSLYYSVWAGNDGSLWDVPVSRYGKKTLFYICLYQYVRLGGSSYLAPLFVLIVFQDIWLFF